MFAQVSKRTVGTVRATTTTFTINATKASSTSLSTRSFQTSAPMVSPTHNCDIKHLLITLSIKMAQLSKAQREVATKERMRALRQREMEKERKVLLFFCCIANDSFE
jgi:uncharacterized protein involved in exopolysaccharide biosynthesis